MTMLWWENIINRLIVSLVISIIERGWSVDYQTMVHDEQSNDKHKELK